MTVGYYRAYSFCVGACAAGCVVVGTVSSCWTDGIGNERGGA